jgi:hypothetical protein
MVGLVVRLQRQSNLKSNMASATQSPSLETPAIKCHTVTEIKFHNRMSLEVVRQYLRGIGATGEIRISLSEGGINGVIFEGRTAVLKPS